MTDKQDLIREIHEYVTTHGGENTATHLLVQAASAIQTQAAELEAVGAGGVQALSAAPAVAAPAAPTPEHIAAMERAWLWMDNQADQQSKGGHATFDLMMLREERDALRAAIDAAPKAAPGEPSAFPMTGDEEESDLGQWQPGTAKPNMDGTYLREFDEGEATSEFHQGVWLRDGFFPSDLQDVRWRGRTAPQQEAQEPYPIDADPQGIRAVVADAITGALAFGAQGANPPPEGHWLTPFWGMAREEAMRTQPAPAPLIARSLAEWHEQDGNVAWWAWNGREWAGEPAWIGTPNCEDWPGYHTHWTPHPEQPVCAALAAQGSKA